MMRTLQMRHCLPKPPPASAKRALRFSDNLFKEAEGPLEVGTRPPSFPPVTLRLPSFHLSGTQSLPSFFSHASQTICQTNKRAIRKIRRCECDLRVRNHIFKMTVEDFPRHPYCHLPLPQFNLCLVVVLG
jgi:hypothetical protein